MNSTYPTSAADRPVPQQVWSSRTRNCMLVTLYVVLSIIAVFPVFSVDVPPLVDYPNHLARLHILSGLNDSAALRENYVIDWQFRPNMAMDLLLPPLARFIPIYELGRLFVAATVLILIAGTIALRRVVHGEVGLWPVLAFLLLYNHILFWGFLSYLFTAGLALLAFSGWIALRDRPDWLRVTVFTAICTILFLAHSFGLFLYGILGLGFEIWWTVNHRARGWKFVRAWAVFGGQFIVAGTLFVLWVIDNDSISDAINRFGPLVAKFVALISPIHFGVPIIDFPVVIFVGGICIFLCTRRMIGFAGPLIFPAILLGAVAAAMPNFLSGVWGTDFRFPTVFGCLLLAGVCSKPEAMPRIRFVIALAVLVFMVRTVIITDRWQDLDAKFSEFRTATQVIEKGKKLLVVLDKQDVPEDTPALYKMLFWHLGALAVIERDVFYPTLFTGHTSVDASLATKRIDSPVGTPVNRAVLAGSANPAKSAYPLGHKLSRYIWLYWIGWPDNFDYVLTIRFDNKTNPYPSRLEAVSQGSYFDIYRVTPTPSGSAK